MKNEMLNKINNIKKIADALEIIIDLYNICEKLSSEISDLKDIVKDLNEKKAIKKEDLKERNIENRKYDAAMIRYIFYLKQERNISAYKIAKMLDDNAAFIYNIINRKIYADIDISNLSEADMIKIS